MPSGIGGTRGDGIGKCGTGGIPAAGGGAGGLERAESAAFCWSSAVVNAAVGVGIDIDGFFDAVAADANGTTGANGNVGGAAPADATEVTDAIGAVTIFACDALGAASAVPVSIAEVIDVGQSS